MTGRSAAAAAFGLLLLPAPLGAASAPGWLKDAVALEEPDLDRDLPAIVLLDDIAVEIGSDGREHTVRRYAARIRTADGAPAAAFAESYVAGAGKLRDLKAWVIKPGGQVIELGRDRIVDRALVNDDTYNDIRYQSVGAGRDAGAGVVFAAEVTSEEQPLFTDFDWTLQDTSPVMVVRRSIRAPDLWAVKTVTFNHAPVEGAVNGRLTQWELRNLPAVRREPAMPPFGSVAARLAVTVEPPGTARLPALTSWASVSSWLAALQDPASAPTDVITAKATAIAGAQTTQLGKIQALGQFVQSVRYVSIQMDMAHGGGYQPHPAAQLLAKNYGDCKDKATLLRSLLASMGIRAYMVGAYLGDPSHVQEEWPSPTQFNHAILAVSVDRSVDAAAVIEHPRFGRLLIVDATDEQTPIGDLSVDLQGSLGLIVTPAGGAVVRLPKLSADRDLIDQRWVARLDAAGGLSGSLVESRVGDAAADMRRRVTSMSASEFSAAVERQISASVHGARMDTLQPGTRTDRFDLTVSFSAPSYAQALQPAMYLVTPPYVGSAAPDLSSPIRRSPIQLDPAAVKESVDLEIPAGFAVDELPTPANLEATFGRFTTTVATRAGHVIIERLLIVPGGVVPANRAGDVRQFFDAVRAARTSPIVIKKSGQ